MIEKVNPSHSEMWKDIKDYEGRYQISSYGRLKSLARLLKNRNGYYLTKEKIMLPMKSTNGYLVACLWENGKQKKRLIHKLVAEHFIPNPNNYTEINHIDEVKSNNKVENLEWCNHAYNMNYGNTRNKISESRKGITPWNKGLSFKEV